jgi:hypothetical protein
LFSTQRIAGRRFNWESKEKGFRDALILETFMQVVGSSPTSRSVARLALVSNDQLLRDATESRLGTATNVHLLESVDALKGLINTLGSAVDEQFIAAIKPHAADMFFKSGDQSTVYYKESVGGKLQEKLRNAAVKLPTGADKYTIESWTIGPPRFVKKQGQRIYWATRFGARLKALKSAPQPDWLTSGSVVTFPSSLSGQNLSSPLVGRAVNVASSLWQPSSGVTAVNAVSPSWLLSGGENVQFSSPTSFISTAEDQLVSHGTATLDASWSLAVTTSGTLTKPRLESVEFVEVVWG